jgi:hypothetical protein
MGDDLHKQARTGEMVILADVNHKNERACLARRVRLVLAAGNWKQEDINVGCYRNYRWRI